LPFTIAGHHSSLALPVIFILDHSVHDAVTFVDVGAIFVHVAVAVAQLLCAAFQSTALYEYVIVVGSFCIVGVYVLVVCHQILVVHVASLYHIYDDIEHVSLAFAVNTTSSDHSTHVLITS
jgi:hypothetical protein